MCEYFQFSRYGAQYLIDAFVLVDTGVVHIIVSHPVDPVTDQQPWLSTWRLTIELRYLQRTAFARTSDRCS